MVPSQKEKNLKKAADAIETLSTESCKPDRSLTEKYFNSQKFQGIINKVVQNALAKNQKPRQILAKHLSDHVAKHRNTNDMTKKL